MASSSSSSISGSNPPKYDVLLSFRGEDTHNTFTSHLYAALSRSKIETFIDDSEVSGTYGEAFAIHEERFKETKDKVQKWRTALANVTGLSDTVINHHRFDKQSGNLEE
ncbi:hypothetical protein Ddye_025124 [Dipteronia dyeriana]|uniref:TIR domain-containing protein n=1 Tax=Dipteronia dyeriana TaxID=168575 RepID=A0AAD9TW90_9ROSI|nr:hypothetical protein Ddye_025124 [Dipteronia dyeriana]